CKGFCPIGGSTGATLPGVSAYTSASTEAATGPIVDLRSDTVTLPTPAMRAAMASAEVGDDFLGEAPTARRLEGRVIELLGAAAGRPPPDHAPRTRVVAVENTHNQEGGAVYPIDDLRALRKVSAEHGLSLYMDGARLFNASVASGVPVSEYCALTDGMMFSFSKGLGAPVGSMVVGSAAFIARARRFRKLHGEI